jgi:hypothetical protein
MSKSRGRKLISKPEGTSGPGVGPADAAPELGCPCRGGCARNGGGASAPGGGSELLPGRPCAAAGPCTSGCRSRPCAAAGAGSLDDPAWRGAGMHGRNAEKATGTGSMRRHGGCSGERLRPRRTASLSRRRASGDSGRGVRERSCPNCPSGGGGLRGGGTGGGSRGTESGRRGGVLIPLPPLAAAARAPGWPGLAFSINGPTEPASSRCIIMRPVAVGGRGGGPPCARASASRSRASAAAGAAAPAASGAAAAAPTASGSRRGSGCAYSGMHSDTDHSPRRAPQMPDACKHP